MNNFIFSFVLLIVTFEVLSKSDFDQMSNKMSSKFDAPIIEINDLKKLIKTDSKIYILDARELSEYNISHLPNSIHIGFEGINLNSVQSKINKKSKIIVYCSVGYRSGVIAEKLKKLKYNVFNLKGGIFAWSNKNNMLLDKNNKTTKKVHGFNLEWSKWLTKENVSF